MPEQEEFVRIIKENQGLIYKVAALYTEQKQDRNDLYQEIVFQLWKSFESFRAEAKISTWMYRIALNTAIGQLNKRKRRGREVGLEVLPQLVADHSSEILEERVKLLHSEIQNLNILEKGIILLLLEGKKYEEIAEITGLSATNVGTRISRIKEKLKSKMTNQ
ncbi:RNA polymerase sigma-70 factor, ECF subfamily [Muriicola jejuensis]|uniref:Sigma-70 family RNA polymerase sigma factor n=1 Tax=Muriicola jejuensis TaxID=504488 RepID=A0A6P0UDK9_9FLAO|nr:RNA polymerase sigma factor [Muriicola jejuensis]NER11285.1 sigma-70 family RNA polymerase sigma factor [Muriicola jejuensis]SMP21780.1 RNA polymerase sigma-70 factor, ECF subfamily [Muriicola jejuensis]